LESTFRLVGALRGHEDLHLEMRGRDMPQRTLTPVAHRERNAGTIERFVELGQATDPRPTGDTHGVRVAQAKTELRDDITEKGCEEDSRER
jgi:hypothetical protein